MTQYNTNPIDQWSILHFIVGGLFGRYTPFTTLQFMLINGGYEIAEHLITERYDIFNTPFGREAFIEGPSNQIADFIITQLGFFFGQLIKPQ